MQPAAGTGRAWELKAGAGTLTSSCLPAEGRAQPGLIQCFPDEFWHFEAGSLRSSAVPASSAEPVGVQLIGLFELNFRLRSRIRSTRY